MGGYNLEKIILLLILLSTSNKENSKGLVNINEYINKMEIDSKYTEDKINLARKLAPLMPLEYTSPINRSILITENLLKIIELKDYMASTNSYVQTSHVPIEDNRERMTRIISVIQEEVPKSNTKHLGSILELIVNIDKYKKMFDLFNVLMKNQNINKNADSLAKMVGPMMKDKSSYEGDGTLDIEKIMNIISILNKPKDKSELGKKEKIVSTAGTVDNKEAFEEKEIKIKKELDLENNKEVLGREIDYQKDTEDVEIIQKKEEKPNEY